MSDIDNFEIMDPSLSLPTATSQAAQTSPPVGAPTDINKDLKVGYVIGLRQDNSLVFDVLGTSPGLMELLGLYKHASTRINNIYEEKQRTGDSLTIELAKMIHSLSNAVVDLSSKVDRLLVEKNISTNSL